MQLRKFGRILAYFISVLIIAGCYGSVRNTGGQIDQPEGYIIISNTLYQDIDSLGIPIMPVTGNDSIQFNNSRKMIIQGDFLIDVMPNIHFEDDKYIKTDTAGYYFFDFKKQHYMIFANLEQNAKIMKKDTTLDQVSFSKSIKYDLFNGVPDSFLIRSDTLIEEKKTILMGFKAIYSADIEFIRRIKFWVDPAVKNFPIQMSYSLSKKMKDGFVYKRQTPIINERAVLVVSFEYHAEKLSDTLNNIFKTWKERLGEIK